jgi:hypothetical protein
MRGRQSAAMLVPWASAELVVETATTTWPRQ